MTEFECKDKLAEKRKNIKTFDDLITYLKDIDEGKFEMPIDIMDMYGAAPRIVAQAALATAWYFCSSKGLTGFQASFTMWDFIKAWEFSDNKAGLKIVDYDNMLYPQYAEKFDKVIDKITWIVLQKEAKKNLEASPNANPIVKDHWESIVNGKVPFGFKIKERS